MQAAVSELNELQTNAQVLDALRRSGASMNERSIPEMREFVKRLGYSVRPSQRAAHCAGVSCTPPHPPTHPPTALLTHRCALHALDGCPGPAADHPCDRHQGERVDVLVRGGRPAAVRPAHRPVHVAAPRRGPRAHPHQRRTDLARPVCPLLFRVAQPLAREPGASKAAQRAFLRPAPV